MSSREGHVSLVISEPWLWGQQRRLTEAIFQPAVSVASPGRQRLFHHIEHEWRGVKNSATPQHRHLSAPPFVSISVRPEQHVNNVPNFCLMRMRVAACLSLENWDLWSSETTTLSNGRSSLQILTKYVAISFSGTVVLCLSVSKKNKIIKSPTWNCVVETRRHKGILAGWQDILQQIRI